MATIEQAAGAVGGTVDRAGTLGPAAWDRLAPEAQTILGYLTAHRLVVQTKVVRAVHLHAHQGAALRGAFFGALRRRFCVRHELTSCQPCTLHAVCPISALVATVDDASHRGAGVAHARTDATRGNGWYRLVEP